MATKTRIRKTKQTPTFTVEAGEIIVEQPQEEVEVESIEETPETRPRITLGNGVFEYVGDCAECAVKAHPVKTEVFGFVEGELKDAYMLGDQLVAYLRTGRSVTKLCQACYRNWQGQLPQQIIRYKKA